MSTMRNCAASKKRRGHRASNAGEPRSASERLPKVLMYRGPNRRAALGFHLQHSRSEQPDMAIFVPTLVVVVAAACLLVTLGLQLMAPPAAAAELDPRFADAVLNRAQAYLGKHDLERARQDLQAALEINPKLASAKDALAKVNKLIAESAAPPTSAPNHAILPWPLALPFAGVLLSIALGPLGVREWWRIHYEKAAAFWAGLTLIGLSAVAGPSAAAADFVHSMALEYLPFILLLFALYTAA